MICTTLLIWHPSYFRWSEQPVAPLLVLKMLVAADCSSCHHRHPTSRNIWPPKLSYSANLSKGNDSSSSRVGTMSTNLRMPAIQSSWVLSFRCSIKQKTPWCRCMDSHNRVQVHSTSVAMFWCKQGPHNNFTILLVFDRTTTMLCCQLIM